MNELSRKILDLRMPENDADASTIRQYLLALIPVGFQEKRPFGNSGWESEIYGPMVDAGIIPGRRDADGWLEDVDRRAGEKLIQTAIQELIEEAAPGIDAELADGNRPHDESEK